MKKNLGFDDFALASSMKRNRSFKNSDWGVHKDIPPYGLKEHTSVDTNHGFVLATTMTPALVSDTN